MMRASLALVFVTQQPYTPAWTRPAEGLDSPARLPSRRMRRAHRRGRRALAGRPLLVVRRAPRRPPVRAPRRPAGRVAGRERLVGRFVHRVRMVAALLVALVALIRSHVRVLRESI